ncbi:MAG: hypothetical protein MRERV_62c004 [Mycoplasmataceae bacterium RV_VA103A]|nr:MAG: hypothetical protein MRERV_62c004 [Mycoplasmataceae bacterium RV_VA103A]
MFCGFYWWLEGRKQKPGIWRRIISLSNKQIAKITY